MRFSTGWLDALFGEKLINEMSTDDGSIIRRKVTRKWLEKMQGDGHIGKGKPVVRVHHLAIAGYKNETWVIGENIDQSVVDEWLDLETHHLYAMSMLDKGSPVTYFMKRDKWQMVKSQLESQGLL
jgi:hypothetical protein